jgi:hypothetical protein
MSASAAAGAETDDIDHSVGLTEVAARRRVGPGSAPRRRPRARRGGLRAPPARRMHDRRRGAGDPEPILEVLR